MKYIFSIIFLFSFNTFAAECMLHPEPNVQGCRINGYITSNPSKPDNEKVWVCINYKQVNDDGNLTKFNISGRVKAPISRPAAKIETKECDLIGRTISNGSDGSIYDSCGDYRIYTSIQTQTEKNPREGYRINLVIESDELTGGKNIFAGEGKSVCEIGFMDAQIAEHPFEAQRRGMDCR